MSEKNISYLLIDCRYCIWYYLPSCRHQLPADAVSRCSDALWNIMIQTADRHFHRHYRRLMSRSMHVRSCTATFRN